MRIELNLPEEILRNAIDAINCYLEECEAPHCDHLTLEDLDAMEDLELAYAAALVGNKIHKAVLAQTKDKQYKDRYMKKWGKEQQVDRYPGVSSQDILEAAFEEFPDEGLNLYPNLPKDACCKNCKYYEDGPFQGGFADGFQYYCDGYCHQDDRARVNNPEKIKCSHWKCDE